MRFHRFTRSGACWYSTGPRKSHAVSRQLPPDTRESPLSVAPQLETFFARASVLATLLRSQLALPLLYPLNTRGTTPADALHLSRNTPWDDDPNTLAYGLSQVAPAVTSLAHMASIMQIALASSYLRNRHSALKNTNPMVGACASSLPAVRNSSDYRSFYGPHRTKRPATAECNAIHRLRHRVWTQRQPFREAQTAHLGWRASQPPPKLSPRPR